MGDVAGFGMKNIIRITIVNIGKKIKNFVMFCVANIEIGVAIILCTLFYSFLSGSFVLGVLNFMKYWGIICLVSGMSYFFIFQFKMDPDPGCKAYATVKVVEGSALLIISLILLKYVYAL